MRERLHRFNEDRTRMMVAMSHDLRTPLTRLRMRIEMAEGLNDQQKMLDELGMMNGMVESILSFTWDDVKREAKSLVDLSALVEGIAALLSRGPDCLILYPTAARPLPDLLVCSR
jgi:signal transduction histidine kinase